MATIRKELIIDVPAEDAWDALRDWGALHERLAPGFVTGLEIDGNDRLVTFATGMTLRETFIASDDEHRRLAWAIVDGPYSHHNGSAQVIAETEGTCRMVWISDLLPDEAAPGTEQSMEAGINVMKRTIEAQTASTTG